MSKANSRYQNQFINNFIMYICQLFSILTTEKLALDNYLKNSLANGELALKMDNRYHNLLFQNTVRNFLFSRPIFGMNLKSIILI